MPTTSGVTNHMIVPDDIKLSVGGIANFIGSGFHFVTVYRVADKTRLSDVAPQIMPGQEYVLPTRPALPSTASRGIWMMRRWR